MSNSRKTKLPKKYSLFEDASLSEPLFEKKEVELTENVAKKNNDNEIILYTVDELMLMASTESLKKAAKDLYTADADKKNNEFDSIDAHNADIDNLIKIANEYETIIGKKLIDKLKKADNLKTTLTEILTALKQQMKKIESKYCAKNGILVGSNACACAVLGAVLGGGLCGGLLVGGCAIVSAFLPAGACSEAAVTGYITFGSVGAGIGGIPGLIFGADVGLDLGRSKKIKLSDEEVLHLSNLAISTREFEIAFIRTFAAESLTEPEHVQALRIRLSQLNNELETIKTIIRQNPIGKINEPYNQVMQDSPLGKPR